MRRNIVPLLLAVGLLLLAGCGGLTGEVSPTATLATGVTPLSVYLAFSDGSFSALTTDQGKLRWQVQNLGSPASGSLPVLTDSVVYVGGKDGVYALNASDGKQRWHYQANGYSTSSPKVADGVVYDSLSDGNLYALNANDGTLRWHSQLQEHVDALLMLADGVAYVKTESQQGSLSVVYALSASDGTVRWKYEAGNGAEVSLAEVVDEQAYILESKLNDPHTRLHAISVSDGHELWHFPKVTPASVALAGADQNTVIVTFDATNDGSLTTVYALNAADGGVCWQTPFKNTTLFPGAFAAGGVYLGSDAGKVVALTTNDGSVKWHSQTQGTLETISPAFNGVVYSWFLNDGVYALNTSDGSVKWHYQTPGKVEIVGVLDGQAFGMTTDPAAPGVNNYVFALSENTGVLLWRYDVGKAIPQMMIG